MGFGGVGLFTQLSDTPRTYAGQALKALSVRAGEDGLEFAVGLPSLDLGAGFNFLRVSQLGGELFVEWADIQSLVIALTGALNRLITPPELLVSAPSAAAVVAAGAAGGFTAGPNLPAPVPAVGVTVALV